MREYAQGRRRAVPRPAAWGRSATISVLLGLILLAIPSLPALANEKFAAIAVDARNGRILFAENADATRFPASLTKMMTLYVLFQDLKAGRITLQSPIRVSARAASMAPSKLGVPPGKSITVETAIRALIVKSANDVAAAVAENLGGSEAAFAERMTRTARALGMSHTTFANASGLPDPRQVTTARDMATLGLRLMRDFPQYYPYFRSRSFTFAGRVIHGHNRLLGSYEGADGIKTGYINASGFNLVTSVRRGDKRLVGVVMGGRTGASRNAYMMKMLDRHFAKAARGKTIAALAGSARGAIDPIRETAAAADDARQKAQSEMAQKKPGRSLFGRNTNETRTARAQDATGIPPVEQGDNGGEAAITTLYDATIEPPNPTTADQSRAAIADDGLPAKLPFAVKRAEENADPAGHVVASSEPHGDWSVQVGAYASKNDAQARLRQVRQQFPDLLEGVTALTVTVEKDSKITYRARFSGFTERAARSACDRLARRKIDCYVLSPAS